MRVFYFPFGSTFETWSTLLCLILGTIVVLMGMDEDECP